MHYFVDGYNLLFRTLDAEDELKGQRDALLRELTAKCELLKLDVTIVFDAAFQPGGVTRSRSTHVEVIYTALGETADTHIINELKAMPKVKNETVVTSDKRLAWEARRYDSLTVEVSTFLVWLESRYRNKMRKLHKKPKESVVTKIVATRVAPVKKSEPPPQRQTPEGCLDYYLYTFEQHLQQLEIEQPPPVRKSPTKTHLTPDHLPPAAKAETPGLSEEERWLRLFMRRLEEDSSE